MSEKVKTRGDGKAKILLLTGFLGSGKTTLLRNILSWEEDLSDTAVLVNELGEVGIDGSLIKGIKADVVELTSGCVCCSIKSDLARTLTDIWNRYKPGRILIEATGIAEPASVASVLEEEALHTKMVMQKTITVLDIRFWVGREKFGPFFMNQVKQADLILLNKVDAAGKKVVSECLKEIHESLPSCHVIPTEYCNIDPDTLWSDHHRRIPTVGILDYYQAPGTGKGAHEHHHDHHAHHDGNHAHHGGPEDGFVTFVFQENEPIDENRFKTFLDNVPWDVFRIKGPVLFSDRTALLNFVAGDANWETWGGENETRLVFIGWNSDKDKVMDELKRCLSGEGA